MKNKPKTNQLIDIFKLFFAICVVAIHTNLLNGVKYGYMLKCNIFRLAVPFFFICSGYYLADRIINNNYDVKIYIKKNYIKYFIWCLIYAILFQILVLEPYNLITFLTDIKNIFYLETTTVFWFVGVLIFFGIIIYIFKDKKILHLIFISSIIFFLIGLSFNTYKYLFIGTKWQIIIDFLLKYYLHNRYPIFTVMFPFMGYYMRKYNIIPKLKIWQVVILLLISWGLLILESNQYYNNSLTFFEYDYFLSTTLVAGFLFILLSKISLKINFNTKVFRSLSISIFYYHYIFVYFYQYLLRKYSNLSIIKLSIKHSSIQFLIVLSLTLIFTLIIYFIKRIFNKKQRALIKL